MQKHTRIPTLLTALFLGQVTHSGLSSAFPPEPSNTTHKVQITVQGAVLNPDVYSFNSTPGIKLLDALAAAGGLTAWPDKATVTVQRGSHLVLSANVSVLLKTKNKPSFYLCQGDVVVVTAWKSPYALNWGRRDWPQTIPFDNARPRAKNKAEPPFFNFNGGRVYLVPVQPAP